MLNLLNSALIVLNCVALLALCILAVTVYQEQHDTSEIDQEGPQGD